MLAMCITLDFCSLFMSLLLFPSISFMLSFPTLSSFSFISYYHKSFAVALGVIKTALPNMDREVKEEYQVLIQAKDMGGQLGGLAGTTIVNITLSDVNDNPPRFSKSKCTLLEISA